MISRPPAELRSGIVPQVLSWFIECAGAPGESIDPKVEALQLSAGPWDFFQSAVRHAAYRTPYEPIVDYMDRWWYLPELFGERARVHRIRRSDHDRHLHDHPWHFVSVILEGGYTETIEFAPGVIVRQRLRPGDVVFRHAQHRHRLEIDPAVECWTLVFTSHNCRDWGFWTENGFVPWTQYDLLEPA